MLKRWVKFWSSVQDRAAATQFDLMFPDPDVAFPTSIRSGPPRPRRMSETQRLGSAWLREVEALAERMVAIAHVLEQRAPVDDNSHLHHLEEVGRAVYTAKAVLALALGREGDIGVDTDVDPIFVARFDVRAGGEHDRDESWTEVIVPPGLRDWRVEVRRDSSY